MIAFEKSVGAVVFRKTDKEISYLLLDYGKMKKGKDHYWNFVKGHVEKGETEEETMRRETIEETGISDLRIVPGFRDTNRYVYKAYGEERKKRKQEGKKTLVAKISIYFLAETKSENINISEEHTGFVWLPFEEAKNLLNYKSSKKTLEKANKYLKKCLF